MVLARVTAACLFAATLPAPVVASEPEGFDPIGGVRYLHVSDADNSSGIVTFLDHPLLNGIPDAIALATQVYGPPGGGDVYNNSAIGLFYDSKSARWTIFNEDEGSMPEGVGFNVLVVPASPGAVVHTTSETNVIANQTKLSGSFPTADSSQQVFAIHNASPSGTIHPHYLGVWHNGEEWTVYHEDQAEMGLGISFNVAVGSPGARGFLHVATAGNSLFNTTDLDHPDLNGNPSAWLLVSHVYGAVVPKVATGAEGGSGSNIYLDRALGVWYDPAEERWTIFDQAGEFGAIPLGTAFQVLVDPNPSIFLDDFDSGALCNWSSITGPPPCK